MNDNVNQNDDSSDDEGGIDESNNNNNEEEDESKNNNEPLSIEDVRLVMIRGRRAYIVNNRFIVYCDEEEEEEDENENTDLLDEKEFNVTDEMKESRKKLAFSLGLNYQDSYFQNVLKCRKINNRFTKLKQISIDKNKSLIGKSDLKESKYNDIKSNDDIKIKDDKVNSTNNNELNKVNSTNNNELNKVNSTNDNKFNKQNNGKINIRNVTNTKRNISSLMSKFIPNNLESKENFQGRGFCTKFSDDGSVLCCATQDFKVHLYDTTTWKKINVVESTSVDIGWTITDIDYSPDKKFVIFGSWSQYVHLCTVKGKDVRERLNFEMTDRATTCMFGLRFSPDNNNILAGRNHGFYTLYNIEKGKKVETVKGHTVDINTITYLTQSPYVFATGSDDCLVKVWDLRSNSKQCSGGFVGAKRGITSVASKGDGNYLIANSKDNSLKLWDVRLMRSPKDLSVNLNASFDYRYDNYNDTNKRHRLDNSIMTYKGHEVNRTLIRCDFSPKYSTAQRYVYSGSACGRLHIWNTLTGELVKTLAGHRSIVRSSSWHPYKPIIASCGWDNRLVKWNYRSTV